VGIGLPEPADTLAVEPWAYRWHLRLEHARTLPLVGRTQEAKTVLDEVLADPAVPERVWVDGLVLRQTTVDAAAVASGARPTPEAAVIAGDPVPLLTQIVGSVVSVELALPVAERWRLAGLSVAGNDDGFAVHLTAAAPADAHGGSGYRHFLQEHDASGVPIRVEEVLVEADRARLGVPDRGFASTRLLWWEGAWHGLADPVDGAGASLVRLDPLAPTPVVPLPPAPPGVGTEDWVPVISGGRLLVVTGVDPFELVEWDGAHRRFARFPRTAHVAGLAGWTGGSPGLRVDGGHLFAIRRIRRGYRSELITHRFLAVDERLRPTAASKEFVFQRFGRETCLGLARSGGDLLCTYASDDHRGWLSAVGLERVLAGLRAL
jgi:hypothetical protein